MSTPILLPPICNTSSAVIHTPYNPTPVQLAYNTGLIAFGVTFDLFCVIIFAIAKRILRSDRLAVRRQIFVWTTALASLVHLMCTPLIVIAGPYFPCSIWLILVSLVTPLIGGTCVGKLLVFFFYSTTAQAVEEAAKAENIESPHQNSVYDGNHSTTMIHSFKLVFKTLIWGTPLNDSGQWSESLKWLRFIISRKGILSLVVVVFTPFFILSIALLGTDRAYIECYRCRTTTPVQVTIILMGLTCVGIGILVARRIQKFKDPFGLARECTFFVICCAFALFGYLLQTYQDSPVYAGEVIDHKWILAISLFTAVAIQSLLPISQAIFVDGATIIPLTKIDIITARINQGKKKHRNHAGQVGGGSQHVESYHLSKTGGTGPTQTGSNLGGTISSPLPTPENMDLDYILKDGVFNKLFETHVKAELGLESLFYLQDAMAWKESYYDSGLSNRRNRFKRIFRSYIANGSNFEVNLPWQMKDELIRIHNDTNNKEDADIPYEAFDSSIEEIRMLLITGALKRFKASKAFKTACEDLQTVRNQVEAGGAGGNSLVISMRKTDLDSTEISNNIT
jgi:hypothetical protein